MLIINKQQLDKMAEPGVIEFEANMLKHIKSFNPLHTGTVDDETLIELIRLGKQNAEEYGFNRVGPVRFYIELMTLLGAHFDTDPQYPWVQVVLHDSDFYPNQISQADQLHNLYMDYHKNVMGEKSEYEFAALIRIIDPEVRTKLEKDYTRNTNELINIISSIYPEKAEFLGHELLNDLINRAYQKADEYQINFSEGKNLFVGLTFTIGHKFDNDPMYPWISNTLKKVESSEKKHQQIKRLIKKIQIYIAKSYENLSSNV